MYKDRYNSGKRPLYNNGDEDSLIHVEVAENSQMILNNSQETDKPIRVELIES